MTTVVPVEKHHKSAACGRDFVRGDVAGVSGNARRHAAIHADKHAHTEQQCARFHTHEHKHARRLAGLMRHDGKMDVESRAERWNEEYVPVRAGERVCIGR